MALEVYCCSQEKSLTLTNFLISLTKMFEKYIVFLSIKIYLFRT